MASRSDISNPYCVHGDKISFRYMVGKDIKFKVVAEGMTEYSAKKICKLLNQHLTKGE